MPIDDLAPHLFVSLTPHGYGHAAMTAPLLSALRTRLPHARLTLQTSLPADWLRTRIDGPFAIVPDTSDFGACMVDAIRVDVAATVARYAALHADLNGVVAREAERLRRLRADLVISNISYVALAAAAEAGIPGIGVSCFSWSDILAGCAPGRTDVAAMVAEMNACYGRADLLLRATPGMDMAGLTNVRAIGPMAKCTASRRDALMSGLGAGQGASIGLIGFGGIGLPLPLADWARLDGWHWLASDPAGDRSDITPWQDTGLSFAELLASVDVVVTKPGYGTFTECAVNGTPVLTLGRPGWPETPYLMRWLEHHGRVVEVAAKELFSPRLAQQLQTLFSLPVKPLPEPSGVAEAAEAVVSALRRGVGNSLRS